MTIRLSADQNSAVIPPTKAAFSFTAWWRKTGRYCARNPEVTPRILAAEAWRAGQQNKINWPNEPLMRDSAAPERKP